MPWIKFIDRPVGISPIVRDTWDCDHSAIFNFPKLPGKKDWKVGDEGELCSGDGYKSYYKFVVVSVSNGKEQE
jgi:hypothetical protein